MNTIPDLLQNSVHDDPEKTAVISNEEEYSYKETTDGEAILYALNTQKNAKAPINPINIIIGQA